jgi:hypothetical protein
MGPLTLASILTQMIPAQMIPTQRVVPGPGYTGYAKAAFTFWAKIAPVYGF